MLTKRYKPQDFSNLITCDLPQARVIVEGNQTVQVLFEDGNVIFYKKITECSGLTLENLKYATIEPNLFTYHIACNNVLHIFCPYVYGGALSSLCKY